MPLQFNRLDGHRPRTKAQSGFVNIDTEIAAGNYDLIDTAWIDGSVAPQIIDTTTAPAWRQVNFQGDTSKTLSAGMTVAWGVALEGTSPDQTRPWAVQISVTMRVEAASRVLLVPFIARHSTGTLSTTRTSVSNLCNQPFLLPCVQTGHFDGTANVISACYEGAVYVGEYDETQSASPTAPFDDDTGPKTNQIMIGGAIANPTGGGVSLAIELISVSVAKDVGGDNVWEAMRG